MDYNLHHEFVFFLLQIWKKIDSIPKKIKNIKTAFSRPCWNFKMYVCNFFFFHFIFEIDLLFIICMLM